MSSEREHVLHGDDLEYVINRYQERIKQFGLGIESLNSGGAEKQRVRHAVHACALRGPRPLVLDIGCGLGDFYRFLVETNRPCNFVGYDIVPEYVEACRQGFPEARFERRNVLEEGIEGSFDSVVMSQVLNNRYAHSNNLEVMKEAIRLAFEHAQVSVSIDMMSTYAEYTIPELFYYNPEAMFRYAKSLARRVVIRHDYRCAEFTIQLYRLDVEGYVP